MDKYNLATDNNSRNNPIYKFQKTRRKMVYMSLDEQQKDRYNEFMSSKFDDKKIKDLL